MSQLNSSQLNTAYRQGNLEVLLSQMTAKQKVLWHQEIVRQGMEVVLPQLSTPEEKEFGELVNQWVEAPAEERAARLADYAFDSGLFSLPPNPHLTPPDNAHRVLLAIPRDLNGNQLKSLLVAINPLSLSEAGREIVNLIGSAVELSDDPEAISASVDAAWNKANRRQLDAAWTILNGQAPADGEGAEGPDEDYRAGNLSGLINRLDDAQAGQFRAALFEQLMHRIPPIPELLDEEVRVALQNCLDAARHWPEKPGAERLQALQEAVRALDELVPPATISGLAAMDLLSDLKDSVRKHMAQSALKVADALVTTASADLDTAARAVTELELSLLEPGEDEDKPELHDEDAGADPADMLAHPGQQQLAWWQVEAAWAVLNDSALPPLGTD